MRLKVCLELVAEAGTRRYQFHVRRQCIPVTRSGDGKALSVTQSRVRETTKLPRTLDWSRMSSQRRTSFDRYCGAMMTIITIQCAAKWVLAPFSSSSTHPQLSQITMAVKSTR